MIYGGKLYNLFRVFNTIIMLLILIVTLYPFWYVFIISVSNPLAVMGGKVGLVPVRFEMVSYQLILETPRFWSGYANTVKYTVVGVLLSLSLTIACAYPLSKKRLKLRKAVMIFIVFTMFFDGGLIPLYLLVRKLGLIDTLWAITLPVAIAPWNMIVMRVFLERVPESLEDSAKIDGANDWQILRSIYFPLSKPIIATIGLFYAVAHWNSWFSALIFLNDPRLQPVSLFLRSLVLGAEVAIKLGLREFDDLQRQVDFTPQTLRTAAIILVVAPIVLIYPFIQKYFVKGMLIGSLKGGN